jgi:magnesium-transporting ATPase (P-type)
VALQGALRSEHPNNSLYTYEGTLSVRPSPLSGFDGGERQIPLGPDQILLRGAQIRNTPWLYGIAVFTGHDTKLMRNATAAPIKRTKVERQVNTHILFLFAVLMALSLGSSIGDAIRSASKYIHIFRICLIFSLSGSLLINNGISCSQALELIVPASLFKVNLFYDDPTLL